MKKRKTAKSKATRRTAHHDMHTHYRYIMYAVAGYGVFVAVFSAVLTVFGQH